MNKLKIYIENFNYIFYNLFGIESRWDLILSYNK